MAGFPIRPSRSSWGVPLKDERMREDPRSELCAEQANLLFWQLAGLSMTAPLIVMQYQPDDGGAIDERIPFGVLAWDSTVHTDEASPYSWVTVTVHALGDYTFTFDANADDETGASLPVTISAGAACCISTVAAPTSATAIAEVTVVTANSVRVKTRGLAVLEYHPLVLVLW